MSFIKRHTLLLSTLIGAIAGYAVLHPFGMIVHNIFHPHKEGYMHIHWGEILLAFEKAFSLDHWAQSLSYIILSGAIGYLFGKTLLAYRKINEHLETLSAIGENAAGIIHDLNNPLTVMMLSIELIKRKSGDPKLNSHCGILEKQAKRLSNMITNIKLTAQSAKTIALSKEQIDLESFLQSVISNMTLKHEIRLNIKCGKEIYLDKRYFERVFWNLLNNADEALENIDKARINIIAEESNGFIVISISDNGRGISKETLPHLFKVGNTFGKRGGSGLGLYNCKKIVEAHGGRIRISSESNRGTTVFVNIPK